MAVSSKHILSQGPVIASIGRTALAAIAQKWSKPGAAPVTPGPTVRKTLPPRPKDLVSAYVRHVGGDPSQYKTVLPPHLFPQWGFGIASETLKNIPYPLTKVLNGGCRLEIHAPLPANEPLEVSVRLEGIDDNGRRAVLHQVIETGTRSQPNALTAHLYAIVPLPRKKGEERVKKDKPRVPEDAREVAFWKVKADAGLDFAKLTGDFNPVHWVPAYARASGFKNVILHGFSTMARAYEGLNRTAFKGARQITLFDVKFTRPLVLPGRVGLYIGQYDASVYVGDAPGGPAYMIGTVETEN